MRFKINLIWIKGIYDKQLCNMILDIRKEVWLKIRICKLQTHWWQIVKAMEVRAQLQEKEPTQNMLIFEGNWRNKNKMKD
jgi:hypothetical protein